MAGFEIAVDEAVDIPRVVIDLPTFLISKVALFMSFHPNPVLERKELEVGSAAQSRSGRIEMEAAAWEVKARRATVLETIRVAG
mmetsp:Transcript_5267/g.11547  ORF Transcript_5267/g.11547 Transcript_5267/m.11547 type:complete len:84 (-) Transcript_5267:258-509(-)